MNKDASPSASNKPAVDSEVEKNKHENDLDIEDFDLLDDYTALPSEHEEAIKKMATRRKIEMYWEKKRLKEQLGDIDDIDLDF